jgi:Zn-dependent protease
MSAFEEQLAPATPYDLRFRIGDIPVRVHPYFWLSTLFLGLSNTERSFGDLLIHMAAWAAVLFVSILVHELGHVLMGRYFGSSGHILLTGFCGLAIGSSNLPERWQRNAVSLAGPGAGFLLAGVVAGLFWLYSPDLTLSLLGALVGVPVPIGADVDFPPEIVEYMIFQLLWINIFWGLVNLLPIWPLDGGQISREVCEAYRGREGLRLSVQISLATAAGLAVFALVEVIARRRLIPYFSLGRSFFSVVFFGLLAFNSWQLLRYVRYADPRWEEDEQPRQAWERDPDWWKHGGDPDR